MYLIDWQFSDINEDDDPVRHVGFAPDIDELAEKDGKLHRRDTPHHLKNKRISVSGTRSALDPEEKIRQILAQVAGRRLSSETTTVSQRSSNQVRN